MLGLLVANCTYSIAHQYVIHYAEDASAQCSILYYSSYVICREVYPLFAIETIAEVDQILVLSLPRTMYTRPMFPLAKTILQGQ